MSDLVEPIASMDHEIQEAPSTEEILRMIMDTNKRLESKNVSDIALVIRRCCSIVPIPGPSSVGSDGGRDYHEQHGEIL